LIEKSPSRDTLGREVKGLQSFKIDVDLQSPHLGALNPSLTLDFYGRRRKSLRGGVRERGEATRVREAAGQM
jgi:hypothetical protein